MARKYKAEFSVTMTVKSENEDTPKDIKRLLKEKADSVSDMRIEIGEVTQTYPKDEPAPEPPKAEEPKQEAPPEVQAQTFHNQQLNREGIGHPETCF
jgi:hypothetical protein